MNDFPPPPDDPVFQQLSEDQRRELFECAAELRRLDAYFNAAKEHVFPKPGSTIDLANRLRKARELAADKRPIKELSLVEQLARNARLEAVKELDRMFKEATETSDAADGRGFFYRLSEASKLSNDEMGQPLDSYGATVIAISELRETLGCKPSRSQIIDLVEQWRKEGGLTTPSNPTLSRRHWDRVFEDPFIAAFLRGE